jgi:hypothetical protein
VTCHFASPSVNERALSFEVDTIKTLGSGIKQKLHEFRNAKPLPLRNSASRHIFIQRDDVSGFAGVVAN